MLTEKNVAKSGKNGELENKTVDNAEMESLTEEILMDFEPEKLPFNENLTQTFIKYLYLLGLGDRDAIYSLFKDNAYRSFGYSEFIFVNDNQFKEFHRIFFWHVCNNHAYTSHDWGNNINETNKYIRKITMYILENEMDLLLTDIEEYIKKYIEVLDSEERKYQKREYDDLSPYCCRSEESEPYKFYPPELLEKIREIIPERHRWLFVYGDPIKSILNTNEECEEKKIEQNVSEKSDAEKHSSIFEIYRKMFPNIGEEPEMKPEVSINPDEKHIKHWTKKDFYDKWDTLVTTGKDLRMVTYENSIKTGSYVGYAGIIAHWGKHFPLKLLKTEVEKGNNKCIEAVSYSKNKHLLIPLFAYLVNKNYDIAADYHCNEPVVEDGKIVPEAYYSWLIALFVDSRYASLVSIYRMDDGLENIILRDILDIINCQSVIGQRILDKLKKDTAFNYYFRYELTSEQVVEKEKLKKLSMVDDGGGEVLTPVDSDRPPNNEFDAKIREILNNGEGALVLRQIRGWADRRTGELEDERLLTKVKIWLYEDNGLDLKDDTFDNYNWFRNNVLEKPFFFPKHSTDNINIMANYFYRELLYSDFINQPEQEPYWYFDILWKRYWQNFIEKTYEDYQQVNLEKPALPIIAEFAEYLLSRTDGMLFFTAIEGLIHCHYRAFLTGCRKLQIEKLLKKGALRQEEEKNLIAMAENSGTDYYAWSDEEIKKCLLPETDLEKLHTNLEPEFMVKIFDKSILWVIGHKDSELWLTAPWFGMRIFNKSYVDRPSIWAKHLIKLADEWTGSENMLVRICFALGHLREPLGGEVPTVLQKIVERQEDSDTKRRISIQRNLFNRENFNKGHHRNPLRRVELCKEELIKGQNREVNLGK